MAANGSGWSCHYTALLYANPNLSIPLPDFKDGLILVLQLSHFLHVRPLPKFMSLNETDSWRIFCFPTAYVSTMESVKSVASFVLQSSGIPTTDQDSLARRLFSLYCRLRESSALVLLGLEFEIVTDLRTREEVADWCLGGTVDSVVVRTLRAAKPAIDGLERTKFDASTCSVDECMVCLEEFEDGEEVTWMPCRHGYHQRCIEEWLTTNHRCPICRFPMPWVQWFE